MSTPVPTNHDEVTVDRIAAAVRKCPTVARMSGGTFGEVATYLPGRRVPGVAIRDTAAAGPEVEVRVVAKFGPTIAEISEEVEAAVRSVLPDHRVLIGVDDLDNEAGGDPAAGH